MRQTSQSKLAMALTVIGLPLLMLSACASTGVKPGETVKVSYTCRRPDGRVVLTTNASTASNQAALAPTFLPYKQYGPELMVAGGGRGKPLDGKLNPLESEAVWRIAQALPGLSLGQNHLIVLKAEVPAGLKDADRYITIGRRQSLPLERRMKLSELKAKLGHEPKPGEQVFALKGFSGTLKAVKGDEAVIAIKVPDGQRVAQPYGTGTVKLHADHYEIITEVSVGQVYRTLNLIGRVVAVTDNDFTLDYGQPFGGEDLSCDVLIEAARTAEAKREVPSAPVE